MCNLNFPPQVTSEVRSDLIHFTILGGAVQLWLYDFFSQFEAPSCPGLAIQSFDLSVRPEVRSDLTSL